MKSVILSLRVSRRALAAVTVENEELGFRDGRHLSSRSDRAVAAAERYLMRVLELTTPTLVVIDAPHKDGSTSARVVEAIKGALARLSIPAETVSIADVLSTYGLPGVRSRTELARTVEPFWPELAGWRGKVKPYLLDAAAVALYEEVRQSLGVPQPT